MSQNIIQPYRLYKIVTLYSLGALLLTQVAFGQKVSAPVLLSASNNIREAGVTVHNNDGEAVAGHEEGLKAGAGTNASINLFLQEISGQSEKKTHKKFYRFLKRLHLRDALNEAQADGTVYLSLANLFSRVKLYPLAMKCYLKTVPLLPSGVNTLAYQQVADSVALPAAPLEFTAQDDSLYEHKADWLQTHANEKMQVAVNGKGIVKAFDDDKDAIAYALLFQVKQPVPGKGSVFKGIDAGHTFITLIKYNRDSSTVCRTFGFYPQKDNILSGTPLCPTTASVFKNDEGHNWDTLLGRFVSRLQFKKVLKLIGKFEATEYKLSKNNCADFALQAAALAGIYIDDTKAKWPLGYGNNPATIGQSILQGKVRADSLANGNTLFSYSTVTLN